MKPVADGERGSATVEFLGGTLVLLIPLVYLVLTLVQLQAGTFAATAAARDAARLLATTDPATSQRLAQTAVELTFADFGIEVDGGGALQVTCERRCESGESALVRVAASVALPFLPTGSASVPVSSEAWVLIDPYRQWP